MIVSSSLISLAEKVLLWLLLFGALPLTALDKFCVLFVTPCTDVCRLLLGLAVLLVPPPPLLLTTPPLPLLFPLAGELDDEGLAGAARVCREGALGLGFAAGVRFGPPPRNIIRSSKA